MSDHPEMYLVRNNGPIMSNVPLALQTAVSLAKSKGLSRIVLLVPTKQDVHGTIVGQALGSTLIKSLLKSEQQINGITLSLESIATFADSRSAEVIVAFHVAKDGIDMACDSSCAKAVVYLPWTTEDGDLFEKTWQPMIVSAGGNTVQSKAKLHVSTPLVTALEDLTARVNLSTGITHPADKKAANDLFKRLKKSGVVIDPESVRAWAVSHGWKSRDADSLAKLATRYAK